MTFKREKPTGVIRRSREFWAGRALAQYQWRSGLSFRAIEEFAPLKDILLMYSPYHEMEIDQFFDALERARGQGSGVSLRMSNGWEFAIADSWNTQASLAFFMEK